MTNKYGSIFSFCSVVFCAFLVQCTYNDQDLRKTIEVPINSDSLYLQMTNNLNDTNNVSDSTLALGTLGNPIPWKEMDLGQVYYRPDTCVTYINKEGELATFLYDNFGQNVLGCSLEELAKNYGHAAIIEYSKYDNKTDSKGHIRLVKIKNSVFEYVCDDVEGCFHHLTMVDSVIQIKGMYIGMTKKQYFELYPNKVGLEFSINNFTYNYDWMLCLKLKFKNDKLISMKTGALE